MAAYEVSDSTDWLPTPLAALAPVERAFRCHVCKDFYTSPMVTSCSHSFCSLCIRRCLAADGRCPVCRASDQESKLRGNWALRDAVDAFVQARADILAFARAPPVVIEVPIQPQTSPRQSQTSHATRAATKRKANTEPPSPATQPHEPELKRTRTLERSCKTKATEAMTSIARVESRVSDAPARLAASRSTERADTEYQPDDDTPSCPICGKRVKLALINAHLDNNCANASQPKPRPAPAPAPAKPAFRPAFGPTAAKPPERLPSVSYSLLNDKQLRSKLTQIGLSTTGSRLLLERRHKEWTTIWNANCDSARPKRKYELLQDLDVWERSIGVTVGASVSAQRPLSTAMQQAAMIKDKAFNAAAWQETHNSSFQNLIASARQSRAKALAKVAENKADEVPSPNSEQPDPPQRPHDILADASSERPPSSASLPYASHPSPRDALTVIPDSNPTTPTSNSTG